MSKTITVFSAVDPQLTPKIKLHAIELTPMVLVLLLVTHVQNRAIGNKHFTETIIVKLHFFYS